MLIKIGSAYVDPAEIAAIKPDRDSKLQAFERAQLICIMLKQGSLFWVDATMDEAEAALIDAGVIEEPLADDLPELTEKDNEKAQALYKDGYRYLARDEDCRLYAYKFEPVENQGLYIPGSIVDSPEHIECFFDFISPCACYSIADLLLS